MKSVLKRVLDEEEFLSPYGVRALSRYHAEHPYIFDVEGERWAFRAVELEDERRGRVWETALRTYPGFTAYARRAGHRRISVFILEPKV